jgi:hypothetical protein
VWFLSVSKYIDIRIKQERAYNTYRKSGGIAASNWQITVTNTRQTTIFPLERRTVFILPPFFMAIFRLKSREPVSSGVVSRIVCAVTGQYGGIGASLLDDPLPEAGVQVQT